MNGKIIQKRNDPLIKKLIDIRDRKKKDSVFCEGEKVALELLKSGWRPQLACCLKKKWPDLKKMLHQFNMPAVPIHILSEEVMEFLSDLNTPSGIILSAPITKTEKRIDSLQHPLYLILSGQQLPQNMGAMLRTAEAVDVTKVYVAKGAVDPFHPKVIRGSSGSVFRLSLEQGGDIASTLKSLKMRNVRIVGADSKGTTSYDKLDWTKSIGLIMGSEGQGFSSDEKKMLDDVVTIPMKGEVESLNVGVAAAVCLFEAARQRRK